MKAINRLPALTYRIESIITLIGSGLLLFAPAVAAAAEQAQAAQDASAKWGFLGAALSVGASTIGAGIAVGLVGAAAMGAISERPEVAGRALIFLGLAEGIAIYGLIIAIMILGKI